MIVVTLFVTLTIYGRTRSMTTIYNDAGHTAMDGSLLPAWIHYDNHRDRLVYAKQLLEPINVPSRRNGIYNPVYLTRLIIAIEIVKLRFDSRKLYDAAVR